MSEGRFTFVEDVRTCPMCGHEGMTSDGCCVNCGEKLISAIAHDVPESEQPNWRLVCGPFTAIASCFLMVASIGKATQTFGPDRALLLLIATAFGCVVLIGLTLSVNGILIFVKRMH